MNIVIVEDSRLARNELNALLAEHGDCNIIGEAGTLRDAKPIIDNLRPELLLLDIHLPDGDGFTLLEQINHVPQVIFTTAYDQHAIKAFEFNALDYLLKPIEKVRLGAALDRARYSASPAPVTQTRRSQRDQIFIRDGDHCHFVRLQEVFLFEVEGNYVRVHFRDQRPLLSRSLGYVEERVDSRTFFRANRQQIVNLDYVSKVEPAVGDGLLIFLRNGLEVPVSRRQAKELRGLLEF